MERPTKRKCIAMKPNYKCGSNMGLCSECHRNQAIDQYEAYLQDYNLIPKSECTVEGIGKIILKGLGKPLDGCYAERIIKEISNDIAKGILEWVKGRKWIN